MIRPPCEETVMAAGPAPDLRGGGLVLSLFTAKTAPLSPSMCLPQEEHIMKTHSIRLVSRLLLAMVITATGTSASAAYFQIAEDSASGVGNAFAGGAAIAEDASTVWYNPAGMTRLNGAQFVMAGHLIDPSFKASVNSASAITTFPISGGGGDAGESALVPNLYYTRPITSDFSIGASINAPFGLATEYDSTWAGRYHTIRSDIKTVNFNFSGAYKLNDTLSMGAGINYQMVDAELTQAVDFATLCTIGAGGAFSGACGAGAGFNPNSNPNDGSAKVTADSDAWGYNFGFLAQFQNDLRVGLAYRSKMEHSLSGNFDITTPANAATFAGLANLVNSGATADVTFPETLSLSIFKQLGSRWAVMADVTRTKWSSLPELRIKFDSGQSDSVVTLNLKDAYRYSVGATYKPGGAWMFRGGIALDETPVPSDADGTPRLPDGDRTWFSIGAGLQASPTLSFDFGYAYIMVDDVRIRKTATSVNENVSRGNLSVDYSGSVQVLSAQARWTF
jgi:long-chain fatty acid transport protein